MAILLISLNLKTSEAVKQQDLQILQSILNSVISNINSSVYPNAETIAKVDAKFKKFQVVFTGK